MACRIAIVLTKPEYLRRQLPNHDWPTRAAVTPPSINRSEPVMYSLRGSQNEDRRRGRSRRAGPIASREAWRRTLNRLLRGEFPLARGVDPARRHDVHADPVLDQFDGSGPSHLFHRPLRHIVRHRPRDGDVRMRRTDQDDRAPLTGADHLHGGRAEQIERAPHRNVDRSPKSRPNRPRRTVRDRSRQRWPPRWSSGQTCPRFGPPSARPPQIRHVATDQKRLAAICSISRATSSAAVRSR